MRPDGLIELPNGDAIFYVDGNHSYWRARKQPRPGEDGFDWVRSTRLTGASTLSKVFDWKPDNLLRWYERQTCDGVASLYHDHWEDLTWLAEGDSILEMLKRKALTGNDARDRKGGIGTRTHLVLEALAGMGEMPDYESWPEDEQGYALAVVDWWNKRQPHVLNCEQFVYSATHGYAGRFDLRCFIPVEGKEQSPFTSNRSVLIDLKTGWVGNAAKVQLALYELAAKECGVGSSEERLILQVKEDGTWREVPCRATEDDALACIAVYRGAGRIERESGLPRAKAA